MKRSLVVFLQIIVVLIGIGALVALLWEPQLEGVNAQATQFEIYFKDPFLAYVYLGSIPFFVGVYQAFKVLRYASQNMLISEASVKSLRTIKYCAFITAGAIVAADVFIMVAAQSSKDDSAGAVALGIIATFASIITAIVAARFERKFQNGVSISPKTI